MSYLISLEKCCRAVVNVGGVLLSVDRDIEYVTVERNGYVYGWSERPYFDEQDGEWNCFELYGEKWMLAIIANPSKEVIETLIEVYP